MEELNEQDWIIKQTRIDPDMETIHYTVTLQIPEFNRIIEQEAQNQ